MDKVRLITKIIFGKENISEVNFPVNEEANLNFEIAWDIWEIFEEYIRKPIRKRVANELHNKLRGNFGNYEIINGGFLEGEKYGSLYISPKNWLLNEKDNPILSYALEWDRKDYYYLCYGIVKKDENNPYKGEIPEDFNELIEIQEDSKRNNFAISNYWLVWKGFKEPFAGMWQREFYNEVLNSNIEDVTANYISEIKSLIEKTESDLDKFIEKYKQQYT